MIDIGKLSSGPRSARQIAHRRAAGADPQNKIYMSPRKTNYDRADLVNGLKRTGLGPGDTVFFQVSHLTLGGLECGSTQREVCELLYSAMQEAIGPEGTMLLPAFSFSFYRNENFDAQVTPSIQGPWSSSLGVSRVLPPSTGSCAIQRS